MTFIRDLAALVQTKNISVEIDPLLLPNLITEDKVTTSRTISFNLYRLIYNIGIIQSRRFAVSNRLKFFDKTDLIEKIYHNTDEFRVRIDEIRDRVGVETLKTVSEDFGIGISIVVSEKLFGIKGSTIQRIYGTGRRPDWKCQLLDQRTLVAEGKGATSMQTSRTQEVDAIDQKTKEPADIQIASLSLFNEDAISSVRILDPPADPPNISPMMQNHILRAGHYASAFSFLGNSKLSLYYSQMRRRLEGLITPPEQNRKDETFMDLTISAPTIKFKDEDFAGAFYNVEGEKYAFVGVDKRLLSYRGFIAYEDFENDVEETIETNHFVRYKDGILLIEIENIGYFSNIIRKDEIQNYQENITISDIDEMNEFSFSKYFAFVLTKNGFTNIENESRFENSLRTLRIDLKATLSDVDYYFEFKISKTKRLENSTIDQLLSYRTRIGRLGKLILVTNADFDSYQIDNNITVIGRNRLEQIAKDSMSLKAIILNTAE